MGLPGTACAIKIPKEEKEKMPDKIPGYLDGITGVYQTPKGYYVEDLDVEEFDKDFPYKEKLKLHGQIF